MHSIARSTKVLILGFLQFVVLGSLSSGAWALDLDQMVDFNIPKQKLDSALVQFSEQAKVQITSSSDQVKDLNTDGISGRYKISIALRTILRRSGLSYRPVGQSAISIGIFSKDTGQSTTQNASSGSYDNAGVNGGGKNSSQNFRLAPADQGQDQSAVPVSNITQTNDQNDNLALTEIIVTAQKRSERSIDVPMSLTAINTEDLASTGQTRLQDYFNLVPGLNVTTNDFGFPAINIRGLSTGAYTNPTVGITIDDVPFGPTSSLAAAYQAPDLDPSDLESIEVLRGPQGALYGASSLGGLIRYVTASPSFDQFAARVQLGYSDVYNGAQPGYQERVAVNVPLGDTLAFRASGFAHRCLQPCR